MPAGYGKECEKCYWRKLLAKRIKLDCAALSTPQMAAHFEAFGLWLGRKIGEHQAAITIHRHLSFFMDIGRKWATIPDHQSLLEHFGTLRLRRVLLPVSWMEDTGLITVDANAKKADSDKRRIAATLDKFAKGSKERAILDGYHKKLAASEKRGKTTLRSIRLALSPAAALLRVAAEIGRLPPDQKALDAYLAKTPGQRAAVSGFVGYLRETHKADVVLPKADKGKAARHRRKKLEAEMLALMQEGGESEALRRQWLSVALAYFHGLPKNVGRNIQDEQTTTGDDGGFTVTWQEHEYWIPPIGAGAT